LNHAELHEIFSPHPCEVARRLAAAGLPVFPCDMDKRPLVRWSLNSSADANVIASYWRRFPGSLPAINTGQAGLVILDGDRHGGPDGVTALHALLSSCENIAPKVRTPRDGLHVYFRNHCGLGNRTGSLPAGVDVRGRGGYVIAPGAMLPDGNLYKPLGLPDLVEAFERGSIPLLPVRIIELIKARPDDGEPQPAPITTPLADDRRGRRYAEVALQRCVQELIETACGARNTKLNNVAFHMGRLVASQWITYSKVENALLEAMSGNNYIKEHGRKAARDTIRSGLNSGLRKGPIILRERAS
jgi:Bifunctional DNA primase/polymerase, N-terminal